MALDFFVVPTATFAVLFVFIVLRHERRRNPFQCQPMTVAGGGRKCYDFCGRWGFDESQVEVRDVLNKHATQMPLVQDQ